QRRKRCDGLLGMRLRRHFVQRVTEARVQARPFARAGEVGFQVDLVQDEVGVHARRLAGDEGARHEVVREARLRRDDDEQPADVRRQQLALVLVGAVQQGGALGDLFDHGLVGGRALQVDDVAHRHVGLLAARDALEEFAVDVGEVVAAVRGDDGARQIVFAHAPARPAYRASALAAQMKSLSDRRLPAECVVHDVVQRR
ncbi:conserved hypothetical protein, partial [Ricinus communis]